MSSEIMGVQMGKKSANKVSQIRHVDSDAIFRGILKSDKKHIINKAAGGGRT